MTTELTVYAEDAIATATLASIHPRLADLLTSYDPITTVGAVVRALEGSRRMHFGTLELLRREILIAVPDGMRGDLGRRLCTLTYPAVARIGPFEVTGKLHSPPSTDAFAVARRRNWVALTDATVSWMANGRRQVAAHPTILLNGSHLGQLQPAGPDGMASRTIAAGSAWGHPIGWAFAPVAGRSAAG